MDDAADARKHQQTKASTPSKGRARRHRHLGGGVAVAFVLSLFASHDGLSAGGPAQNPDPPSPLGETDVIDFGAGSLIIPMDGCYQRPTFLNKKELEEIIGHTVSAKKCNTDSQKDDGLIAAYTLVFRLVWDGIPVHWSIRAGKTGWHDIDFSIVKAGGGPVKWTNKDGGLQDRYAAITKIDYRGAPFIISAEHAGAAKTKMARYNQCEQGTCYDKVDIHEAQVAFQAPIYKTVESLPKLAILNLEDSATDLQNEKTEKLEGSVEEALMEDLEGTFYDWVTIPQVLSDYLTTYKFELVWIPPFELKEGVAPTQRQQDFIAKLMAYADAGGHLVAQDGAVGALEGYGDWSGGYDQKQVPTAAFQVRDGILKNGVTSSWDNGNDDERTVGDDYSDPASQFGGIFWTGIGGSKYNWQPRPDRTYRPGVRRMIYSDHRNDNSKDNWDMASWRHKDNISDKGRIYYLGGFHWRRVTAAGFRVLMNTILATPKGKEVEPIVIEVARSAPILARFGLTDVQAQGTFEVTTPPEPAPTYSGAADNDTFEFPHVLGHLRVVDVRQLTTKTAAYEDLPAIFDAANSIPSGADRVIFTNVSTGKRPDKIDVTSANLAVLKPLLGPTLSDADATTLISRLRSGRKQGGSYVPALGGIDRSTMAIIEPSPLIANQRPMMMYVGARDGMLHAICAEASGPCAAAGRELWAFLPRTQLPYVRFNATRLDGSPKVADVFADFAGNGTMEWRTVLTVQTGSGDPSDPSKAPAVYALDITAPGSPTILWERATPASRGAFALGAGLGLAMGPVKLGNQLVPLTFVQTNNGGTGGTGTYVEAVHTATGDQLWQWTKAHSTARDLANPPVPGSGVPGGVTALDLVGQRTIDRVLVPTLFGDVWKLDAATGHSVFGQDPLFRFTADFHPLGAPAAVYRDRTSGHLHAVVVSGGYADANPTTWSPANVSQYAVSMSLAVNQAEVPLDLGSATGDRGFVINLGVGARAFAGAVIAGDELFIVTDASDVNDVGFGTAGTTGLLRRFSLSAGTAIGSGITIRGAAASVDASAGTQTVYAGTQKVNLSGFDAQGSTAELIFAPRTGRELWLRLR